MRQIWGRPVQKVNISDVELGRIISIYSIIKGKKYSKKDKYYKDLSKKLQYSATRFPGLLNEYNDFEGETYDILRKLLKVYYKYDNPKKINKEQHISAGKELDRILSEYF